MLRHISVRQTTLSHTLTAWLGYGKHLLCVCCHFRHEHSLLLLNFGFELDVNSSVLTKSCKLFVEPVEPAEPHPFPTSSLHKLVTLNTVLLTSSFATMIILQLLEVTINQQMEMNK